VAIFQAGGWVALAQAPTPSPATANIEFVNPSPGQAGTLYVSDKADQDSNYHLNSWVQNVPANPTVIYKLMNAAGTTEVQNIGTATQLASAPDTFEKFWDIPANPPSPAPAVVADGTYTLLVQLFSGATEVDRDTVPVTVNNEGADDDIPPHAPQQSQANTVEILYPVNGGPLGIYTSLAGAKNFVMDIKTSNSTDGDNWVKPQYTTSPVGTEPEWKDCNADGFVPADADQTTSTRCTVAATDDVTKVTGVSALANDTPFPLSAPSGPVTQFDESADAHRVLSYPAIPSDITFVLGATQSSPTSKCSAFDAKVVDQLNHTVADVNVDVHGRGPNDQLKFGVEGDYQDASKAPDKGHSGIETGEDCNDGTAAPAASANTQGEHDQIDTDIKHIESTDGTKDNGLYRFSFYSEAAGVTNFTAWVDKDDDDLRCGAEVFEHGSLGWSPTGPTNPPTGVPADLATCPSPSPSGSASPSVSPKPSPSASSPRPSASASTTPAQQGRTVTLVTDKAKVTSGKTVRLSGQVLSSAASCTDSEFIQLKRRIHGETTFVDLASTNTDTQGAYHFDLIVQKNADYTATAPAHDNCATSTSDPVTVLAKVKVFVAVEKKKVDKGDTVRIKAAVRPQHDGSKVILEYKKGRKWVKVKTAKLNSKSIGKFKFAANWKGKRVFRVRWPAQDDDHEAGKSKTVAVTSKA
jgi:hypothetical protein